MNYNHFPSTQFTQIAMVFVSLFAAHNSHTNFKLLSHTVLGLLSFYCFSSCVVLVLSFRLYENSGVASGYFAIYFCLISSANFRIQFLLLI